MSYVKQSWIISNRFTCGEIKIWSNIEKSTNFAKNIDIYPRLLSVFLKTVLDQTTNPFNTKLSRQTSMSREFETNFSFDVKEHTTGNT